jgi:flagellar biosynthesis protein FlhB
VKKAKAVVTNPTHIAIAIAYDKEMDAAPWITTKGSGEMAKQIIRMAEDMGVPVMRNIPLAHDLWERGELYDYVPEDTYEVMAEILRWVHNLKENKQLGIE